MSDDKKKRGPADASRVNVNESYEVRYWTERFQCTEQQLRDCVKSVGPMVKDVEACLAKKKQR
jgi:hypothetical protein